LHINKLPARLSAHHSAQHLETVLVAYVWTISSGNAKA